MPNHRNEGSERHLRLFPTVGRSTVPPVEVRLTARPNFGRRREYDA